MRREERQGKIKKFVEDFYLENRYPPTVRDIQNGVGIPSTSTIYGDLKELSEMGMLERQKHHTLPVFTREYLEKFLKWHIK